MENRDERVRTTQIIWGFATAMLGICIPLTAVTRSGAILPLAVHHLTSSNLLKARQ